MWTEKTGHTSLIPKSVVMTPPKKATPGPDRQSGGKSPHPLGAEVWYVGDSTTDVFAAKTAGITSVFFNGALWDLPLAEHHFPLQ